MNVALEAKVALVTGGGSGIGAAVAITLAREGCDVAIVDSRPDSSCVERSVASTGRRAMVIQADVAEHPRATEVVSEVIRDLGRLDVLVCSAGITGDAAIWNMTEAQWDRVMEVNLKGCFSYNQAVARVFRHQRSGKIVNIASINGLRGKFGQSNYAASKAAVVALSKTLARELGRYDVNVNVVAPGMVLTEMTKALDPEVLLSAARESALGRLATAEDCAEAVVFLCSERARHITGEVLKVDGGQYM